jgi:hypothetical protein
MINQPNICFTVHCLVEDNHSMNIYNKVVGGGEITINKTLNKHNLRNLTFDI